MLTGLSGTMWESGLEVLCLTLLAELLADSESPSYIVIVFD